MSTHLSARMVITRMAVATVFALAALTPAAVLAAEEKKPYTIENGKVDKGTYNGFRRYHNTCHVCHGPDGLGSSFGPSLVDSLKRLSYDDFVNTVASGRTNNEGGNLRVMPGFADNPDVMTYIDDIYGYVKARSDGVLGRGRPERIGQ